MNKLSFKNIFTLSVTAVLTVGSFLVGISQVSAEISGRELTVGLAPADLSGIASKWPYLLLIGLILIIFICLADVFYHFKEKSKK